MRVDRWNAQRDGELTEAAMRTKLERLGYSVSRYVYPPGTCFPNHTHGIDKMDAVFSGTFRITTSEGVADLGPGDAVEIPRGLEHSAQVIGNQPVVSFDAVKAQ